jgi:Holliday junction resolvasome RuvABC endonuclease subunit
MGVPVGTVKKTATGRGNASKEDMMAAARARWPGWEPVDDNEADARWVVVAAAREVKGE